MIWRSAYHTRMRFAFLFVAFLLTNGGIFLLDNLIPAQAAARVFYLDFNHAGAETGSLTQPFRSLSKAVSEAACSDKIYIKDGIYHIAADRIKDMEVRNFRPECLCESSEASRKLTITVDPATKGTVVLAAQGSFGSNPFLNIINSQCITLDGAGRLIVDGSAAVFDPNASLVSLFAHKNTIEQIVIENIEVRNSSGRGISFRQEAGAPPSHIRIRNNHIHEIAQRAIGGFGDTITIEGNKIWRAAMSNENQAYGSGGWPGVVQTAMVLDETTKRYAYSKNIFVRNNEIRDCWGEGILIGMTVGGEIANNTIANVFSVYIYVVLSKQITIDRNHLFRTTALFDRKDKPLPVANGITFASELYSWNVQQVPQMIEDVIISNNLIDNLGKGANYWHDNVNTYASNSYARVFIAHNVLRNLHYTPFKMDHVPTSFSAPANCTIANNIIENPRTGRMHTCDIGDADAWVFSNNNWTGGLPSTGTHPGSHAGEAGFVGLNESVGAAPLNFKLAKGSRNIAAGTPAGIPIDFWGRQRDPAAPSIGIHEYNVAGSPPCRQGIDKK